MPDSTVIDSMPSEHLLPLPSVGQKSLIPAKRPTLATAIVTAHLNQLPFDFPQKILSTYELALLETELFFNERAAELARFNKALQQQMQQTMHWLKENENTILNGIDAAFITTLATILVIARCFPGIGPAFDKIATVMTNLWNGATITAMVGILPAALQHGISRLEWLRLTIDFSSTALLAANITLQIVSWAGVVVAPFIQPLTNAISSWCDTASYSISYYEAWRKGEDTTAISASLKKSVCLAVGATFITAGLIIASVVSHGALPMVFLAAKMCIAAAGLFASQALSASKPAVETKDSTLTLEENIKPAVSSTVTATPIVNNTPSTFSSIKYSVKDSVYRFFDRKYAQSSETLVSTIKPIATPMAAAS